MAVYTGNVVKYGRGGSWYLKQTVTHTISPAGDLATIKVVTECVVSHSIDDRYNTFDTTVGSKTWRVKNVRMKSSVGQTYHIGTFTRDYVLYYDRQVLVPIKGSGDALAGGDTGLSKIDITYTLPRRAGGPPSTPPAPTVTQIQQSSAQVNMKLPNSNGSPITSTRFMIYTAASGGGPYKSVTTSNPFATSAVLTGLTPETDYWAAVWATNSEGNSPVSARTKFRTSAVTAPTPPTDLQVTNILETQADLSWTASPPIAAGMTYRWTGVENASTSEEVAPDGVTVLRTNEIQDPTFTSTSPSLWNTPAANTWQGPGDVQIGDAVGSGNIIVNAPYYAAASEGEVWSGACTVGAHPDSVSEVGCSVAVLVRDASLGSLLAVNSTTVNIPAGESIRLSATTPPLPAGAAHVQFYVYVRNGVRTGRRALVSDAILVKGGESDLDPYFDGDTPDSSTTPVTGYRVQVMEPEQGWSATVFDANTPSVSITATQLPPGSTLVARVQAQAATGISLWSDEVIFQTPSTLTPKRPPTPLVRFITATKVWAEIRAVTAPKPPPIGYEAELTAGGVATVLPVTVGQFMFDGLTPNEEYILRTRAISSAGPGSWSTPVTFRTFTGISINTEDGWPNTDIFVKVEEDWRPVMLWYLVGEVWYCPALGITRLKGDGGLFVENLTEDISKVWGTAVTDTGHGTLVIDSPGATIATTVTAQLKEHHG